MTCKIREQKRRKGIMQKKTSLVRDIIVVGFALFSMFFGAGNVIFPPFLGMEAGSQWLAGFPPISLRISVWR